MEISQIYETCNLLTFIKAYLKKGISYLPFSQHLVKSYFFNITTTIYHAGLVQQTV